MDVTREVEMVDVEAMVNALPVIRGSFDQWRTHTLVGHMPRHMRAFDFQRALRSVISSSQGRAAHDTILAQERNSLDRPYLSQGLALNAAKHGVPVATINFLAALHLKE